MIAKVGTFNQEKLGKHLPYVSPQLQRIRDYVQNMVANKTIHERLIANFDQVWTVLFEPSTRILYKSPKKMRRYKWKIFFC